MATNVCDELMQAWFPATTTVERKRLTETNIRDIAQVLLRTSNKSWSRIPRIYSVLRTINQLQAIDSFLAEDVTDVWFPFSQETLPASFRTQLARLDFLDAQQLAFNTKALNLEREHTEHGHFPDATEVPLKKIGELGKGGYGFIDRVISTISHREYARKLIPRGRTFKKDKQVLRAFERELSNLKRLSQQHTHIIELVGSYTDPKYVGIIMLPVADCNLHQFLIQPLGDGEKSLLRNFFGCLTSALCFLHDRRIRHKDIKPQNVLVKNGEVFLADFGVSLDWSGLNHSTTTGPTWSTPRYGPPEAADHSARNSSADIWSLGCVFLEIWTVLKEETIQALHNYMTGTGTFSSSYCSNLASVVSWIEMVKTLPGSSTDSVPSTWITQMLQLDRAARWTAHTLLEHIREHSSDPTAPFAFAGLCCLDDGDTAESVHSTISEDMNELILRPKACPVPQLHPSKPVPLSSQSGTVHITEVPVHGSPSIEPRKRIQLQPHRAKPSLPFSTDLGHASQARNRGDLLSRRPLPENLHVTTQGHNTDAISTLGQLHLSTPPRGQSLHEYAPVPCDVDKDASLARESHYIITSSASSHLSPPVIRDAENSETQGASTKRWVFYPSTVNGKVVSNPQMDVNAYRKVPKEKVDQSVWGPEYESRWKTRFRDPASKQESLLPNQIDETWDKKIKHRACKPGTVRRQTSGKDGIKFSSDNLKPEKDDHKELQKSVPPPKQAYMKKHYYPMPNSRVRRSPRDTSILHESSPYRMSLLSPMSRSPIGLHKESRSVVTCYVCMNTDYDLPANFISKLGCNHRMCYQCLRSKFKFSVSNLQQMPPSCCTVDHIPLKYAEHLFDDTFKQRWNKMYLEYIITRRVCCPGAGCGLDISPFKIQRDSQHGGKYAQCNWCFTNVCVLCHGLFHEQRDCPIIGFQRGHAHTTKRSRRCYNCRIVVILEESSIHMKCGCSAEFCVACAAPWKTCDCPWFNLQDSATAIATA